MESNSKNLDDVVEEDFEDLPEEGEESISEEALPASPATDFGADLRLSEEVPGMPVKYGQSKTTVENLEFYRLPPARKLSKKSPIVSIRQTGQVSLNAAAVEVYKDYLMYSNFATLLVPNGKKGANKETIAVHFSGVQEEVSAVPLIRSKSGAIQFSDKNFFEATDYDLSCTKQYASYVDEVNGLLIIQLSTGIVVESKKADDDQKENTENF